ncbi:MAG: hypothetical protein O7D95_06120 [Betaproteobacteria bacterium]|nr:hypothetical protein [Betaproteobacteria bacterium]
MKKTIEDLIDKTDLWLRQYSYNQIFTVVAATILLLLVSGAIYWW